MRKGEKVLAGGLGDVIPNKLFYLTEEGVVQYTFDSFWLDEDLPPHHFTCVSKSNGGASISGVAKLLVVINNVALYTDKALTKLACRLTAGTKLGKGSTTRLLSVEKTEKTEEYTIGSIEMDTLADICDRHTEVYFKMRKTSVGYVAPLAVPLWKMAKF